MELQHIEITDLKTTAINVRKKGTRDITDLVPSIKSLGILQPLLVRPNCEGFEIVAGQRRYHALLKIAEDETIEPVPCIVMDSNDDAKAIEASLAENIARLPMDEIDQYKAFSALAKQGLSVEDIAIQFGITERLIKQRLALGNLHPPILTAYRKEEIGAGTLRSLTLATIKQQKSWWELFKSDEYAPQGQRLKEWLFGGSEIPVENALFDLSDYDGATISDLFGDEVHFDDAAKFWTLQNHAIADAKTRYLDEGWSDVIILDIGEHWCSWEFSATTKKEGGKIYIVCTNQGEVHFHEGYLTRKEAKRLEQGGDVTTKPKSELTKAMQNYLDLHRHAAVRSELLDHSGVALRLAVAQIIAGSKLWEVKAEPQKANTEAINDSLAANKANDSFTIERNKIRALLDNSEDDSDTIVPLKSEWHRIPNLHAIFAKLLSFDDEAVTRILTYVVAESLPSSTALIEILGNMLNVDMADHWQPDDTFFDLLRDKQAINAMLQQIGGKNVAEGNITATARVQKQIIKDYLDGTRKPQQGGWQPDYMQSPMQAYTDKGGIEAMANWNEAKPYFE